MQVLQEKKCINNCVFIWFYSPEREKYSNPMDQILAERLASEQHSWIVTKFFLAKEKKKNRLLNC